MTKYPDLFASLAAPFEPGQVKERSAGRGGNMMLSYVTARTVMNRLDDVLGPENWWDSYHATEHSVLCKLTIRIPDGSIITKEDAGGYAGMETRTRTGEMVRDDENDEKSGYSDAFKRAAAKFGVGRYLYRDGVPEFVRERVGEPAAPAPRDHSSPPPERASRREPQPAPRSHHEPPARQDSPPQGEPRKYGAPTTGRALFAWCKKVEEEKGQGLVVYLNKWGKLQDLPGRMIDWDAEQVALGYSEGCRKVGIEPESPSQGQSQATGTPRSADELRQDLIDTVYDLGHHRHGRKPSDREFWEILNELYESNKKHGPIEDLDRLQDTRILSAYLATAKDTLGMESKI
jgi:hypothetical protein